MVRLIIQMNLHQFVKNDLYFYFKDLEINSYEELHNLLSKESLINILEDLGKKKY